MAKKFKPLSSAIGAGETMKMLARFQKRGVARCYLLMKLNATWRPGPVLGGTDLQSATRLTSIPTDA